MLDFDAAHRLVPLCFKLLCSLQFYESTKSEIVLRTHLPIYDKKINFDQVHEFTYLSPFCLVNQIFVFFKVKTVLYRVYRFMVCFYHLIKIIK